MFLAIRERLAKSDPDNAGWQRDLSVSYERIGDALVAQGRLPEALQSYRDGLAISERLAKSNPSKRRLAERPGSGTFESRRSAQKDGANGLGS